MDALPPPLVILMSEDDSKETSNGVDEDEWHLYASADYGVAESLENSEPSNEEETDVEWFDGDDFYQQGDSIDWDAPPCPAPLGIAHVIKIGACLLYTSPSPRDRG